MRYIKLLTMPVRYMAGCMAVVLGVLLGSLPARAVTDQEMEQARTITAQTYLRYANDGSGYLDDLHPTTMAALQKSLKEKERENLKAFQAVEVPTDYASWDKDKLVQYWSVTFFKSPGLSDKGKVGKTRVKSRLLRMNVASPAAKDKAVKETPAPAPEEKPAEPAPKDVPEELAKAPEAKPDTARKAESPAVDEQAERLKEMEAKADSLQVLEEEAAAEEPARKRQDSTWLYIVILCVLVAIVAVLVFFASSTMRKNARRSEDENEETPEDRNRRKRLESEARAEANRQSALREEKRSKSLDQALNETQAANSAAQAAILQADTERTRAGEALREVEALRKRVLVAEQEALAMRTERDALFERVKSLEETLRTVSAEPRTVVEPKPTAPAAPAQASPAPAPAAPSAPQSAPASPAPTQPAPRSAATAGAEGRNEAKKKIYLGRVNARGLFVRADRGLHIESSVYVLETEDGVSGSFRVVRNREVWVRLFDNPSHWLEGGCIIREEGDDDDKSAIITESAGTAVFENSCWRVIRKAKVRFE